MRLLFSILYYILKLSKEIFQFLFSKRIKLNKNILIFIIMKN